MALEQRELASGTKLVGTYKKTHHVCEVVATPEGETRYQLEDGKLVKSPSSAAKAVMNGISANGWRFWSLEGTEPEKAPVVSFAGGLSEGIFPSFQPYIAGSCCHM